jgi:predicted ArsR family transcriptional regulator
VARLADAYPALVETRQVDIAKPALAHLWGCKSDAVRSHLDDLQQQTGGLISYQDLDPANQGGRNRPKVYRITSAKVLVK